MNGWPDPLQLFEIRDAINKHASQVELDGVLFNIKYESDDYFWISPVMGFAPCGRFDLKTYAAELDF